MSVVPSLWNAIYMTAEPQDEEDAWCWLGMILSESWYGYSSYENEKRQARAHELFAWLEHRLRYS